MNCYSLVKSQELFQLSITKSLWRKGSLRLTRYLKVGLEEPVRGRLKKVG